VSTERRRRRPRRSLTIEQFCRQHQISRSTYYELRRRGLGPKEMHVLGAVRISPRADRGWVAWMEAGESASVPEFAPNPSSRSGKSRDTDETGPRRQRIRVFAPKSPARGVKGCDDANTVPRRQKGRSKERGHGGAPKSSGRDAAPKSSTHSDKHRDDDKTSPRRQTEGSKERGHDDKHGDDETGRRRKRRRSKARKRGRSKEAQSGDVRTEPQLDITELKRRLKTGKRLPKDALMESRRWRLPSNCHRNRDRRIERAMLQALTGPGSSEAEQRQAIEQANCTPETPCRRLMCWLCKHRTWFKRRRKLAGLLDHDVPHDHMSWVTVVIDVCKPSPKALRRPMSKFRFWLTEAANAWGVVFFGGFEIDLLLDPRVDLDKTTFKRKTLRALGLDPKSSEPVAVFHVHLIAYHPDQDRGWLSLRLKQRLREPKRTLVTSLDAKMSQNEALDNLTRYPLKTLPPEAALFEAEAKARLCQCLDPEALRLHNKLVNFLAGENGECIAKPPITPRAHNNSLSPLLPPKSASACMPIPVKVIGHSGRR
jgi:hypothetical protein